MVPVFLRVTVQAEDDLDAEVAAISLVRSLGPLVMGAAIVEVRSVISPMADSEFSKKA